MTFGDPNRFAMSVELDPYNHGGHMLYGRACYWIGGQRIGDWDEGWSLGTVHAHITGIVKDSGRRENCATFHLPSEVAFHRLDAALYGPGPDTDNFAEVATYCDVAEQLPMLGEWKIYLVECEGRARLLYRGPTGVVQEFMLNSGEFDRALRATWDQLDEWSEREKPPGGYSS